MIRLKVCMLGAYAVGKTSLVIRFVKSMFSERYQTTIGVKILKKELTVGGEPATLMLWDMHGDDDFQNVRTSYLRGAAGYFVVADGTRGETLEKAVELHALAREHLGEVPSMLLVNKADLKDEWELEDGFESRFGGEWPVQLTSAKSGEGVEAAFHELARRLTAR